MQQNSLFSALAPPSTHTLTWPFVRRRFERLLGALTLTPDQIADGDTKLRGAVDCLNRAYWNVGDETLHSVPSGSYAKGTRVRPPRDIDFLFQLPFEVYQRFQQRSGNRQSQLLQEVKDVLAVTYHATRIRGDGQVVVVPFNSCELEIAPAFAREGGGFLICDTNNGGRYKWVDPAAELATLDAYDRLFNGNVRKLTRMLKQWQRYCDVPIKSFHLEALVMETLPQHDYGGKDEFWFDWLVRDVFAHMTERANGVFSMPVTGEAISLGDAWLSKAQSAHARALKSCDYERNDPGAPADDAAAGEEWQKIFGLMVPRTVVGT
jgi:hypothetical protein